ncbi:hypothetical protein Geob_2754 [Geotalea daltonii FRC-32]|uniref:Uncharacterized protein n=1 Tax=Geotalea daltonii (strain DSM 22248 / JCM 15807 / FRC-32) TaxID=316067 RepID=B9M1M1_GEODF|nr:hypothetical protein Geob_2754 [Geotalea daltonii FRC-32]
MYPGTPVCAYTNPDFLHQAIQGKKFFLQNSLYQVKVSLEKGVIVCMIEL